MKEYIKIHNKYYILFFTCIILMLPLFVIHSIFVLDYPTNFDSLQILLFSVSLFIIQQVYLTLFHLSHLIIGLISGYKLCVLKIGFLKWTKTTDNKMHFSVTTENGSHSYCKMYLEETNYENIHYRLISMYGPVTCVFVITIALVFFVINFSVPIVSSALFILIGLYLSNLITQLVYGQGKVARRVKNNPNAIKAFWLNYKMADPALSDKTYTELPPAWFDINTDQDVDMFFIAYAAACKAIVYFEQKQFEKASKLLDAIITPDSDLNYFIYMNKVCDRLYCELVTTRNPETINSLYTDKLKKFMSDVRGYTLLRTSFACALFIDNSPTAAAQIKADFYQSCEGATDILDVKLETELLLCAESIYNSLQG